MVLQIANIRKNTFIFKGKVKFYLRYVETFLVFAKNVTIKGTVAQYKSLKKAHNYLTKLYKIFNKITNKIPDFILILHKKNKKKNVFTKLTEDNAIQFLFKTVYLLYYTQSHTSQNHLLQCGRNEI